MSKINKRLIEPWFKFKSSYISQLTDEKQAVYDKWLPISFACIGYILFVIYLGLRFVLFSIEPFSDHFINVYIGQYFVGYGKYIGVLNLLVFMRIADIKAQGFPDSFNVINVFFYIRWKHFVAIPIAIIGIICFEISALILFLF